METGLADPRFARARWVVSPFPRRANEACMADTKKSPPKDKSGSGKKK